MSPIHPTPTTPCRSTQVLRGLSLEVRLGVWYSPPLHLNPHRKPPCQVWSGKGEAFTRGWLWCQLMHLKEPKKGTVQVTLGTSVMVRLWRAQSWVKRRPFSLFNKEGREAVRADPEVRNLKGSGTLGGDTAFKVSSSDAACREREVGKTQENSCGQQGQLARPARGGPSPPSRDSTSEASHSWRRKGGSSHENSGFRAGSGGCRGQECLGDHILTGRDTSGHKQFMSTSYAMSCRLSFCKHNSFQAYVGGSWLL